MPLRTRLTSLLAAALLAGGGAVAGCGAEDSANQAKQEAEDARKGAEGAADDARKGADDARKGVEGAADDARQQTEGDGGGG